jgi:hypothetical protein
MRERLSAREPGRTHRWRQVRNYYTTCWRRSPVPFEEKNILSELHGPLRAQVLGQIGAQARRDIPILQVLATR